jgi:hypothetical protein
MLRLTDAFMWEDLPTTDPVTGSLTMAGWIPRIQRFASRTIIFAITFHAVQSAVRVATSDDPSFVFGTGYPFDKKRSPAFELINLAQVKVSIIKWAYCPVLYVMCLELKVKFQSSVTAQIR